MTTHEHNPLDFEATAEAEQAQADAIKGDTNQEATDFEWLMNDERGRRIVWGMLASAGVFQLSFTGEVNTTMFKEGRRNEGLRLQTLLLQHCPQQFLMMLSTHKPKE